MSYRFLMLLVVALPAFGQLVSDHNASLEKQVSELRELVVKLQSRVDQLEKESAQTHQAPTPAIVAATAPVAAPQPALPAAPVAPATGTGFLAGTTLNFGFDGYYAYNFNDPIGRVNLLRAYDVSSNSFSLNQASIILENAPDPAKGKRYGARLDLQFGQATETLSGNAANELRPEIYRNIFQAYGTYVFPVAQGWTVDFGKFASSLGLEGNYTKDQINYSRSLYFNFLPYYHMGVRSALKLNDTVTFNYWVTNGAESSEANNNYKDELFGFTVTPSKTIAWNVNYYLGQEHPDEVYYANGGAPPNSPLQQGSPFTPIVNPPKGKLDIFDSYATWTPTSKLTLAMEMDYVVQRLQTNSSPQHVDGGAAYLRYQISPRLAFGGRAEYLSDRGGMFSGKTQAIKEATATLEYKLAEGFLLRNEWRSDFSNQRYFYTSAQNVLRRQQSTATIGLVWWFGQKQGAW